MEPDSPSREPWVLQVAIAALAWASFCLGMWVGQVQTLALIEAAKQMEANREP